MINKTDKDGIGEGKIASGEMVAQHREQRLTQVFQTIEGSATLVEVVEVLIEVTSQILVIPLVLLLLAWAAHPSVQACKPLTAVVGIVPPSRNRLRRISVTGVHLETLGLGGATTIRPQQQVILRVRRSWATITAAATPTLNLPKIK